MRDSSSIHLLRWPVLLVILIAVIAAGWYWADSSGSADTSSNARSDGNTPSLRAGGTPTVPSLNPQFGSTTPGKMQPPANAMEAAQTTTNPATATTPAKVTAPPPLISEQVRNPTPEELAAIPPPPEAAAAMKAGPPPDVLRGMQNPPQHLLQGLKNPPPWVKNALNPPGSPPPPSAK